MINDAAIDNFRSELTEIDMSPLLNANLATDPNTDYGYLNHCIRAAKKEFYHNEFNKHKKDIRTFETWDTLKEIINKKTFKSDLPSSFVHEGVEIIGLKNVADKLSEYFTEIGPKLAKSIDTANKAQFNHYLTTPCAASFSFVYTKPDDIEKIIRNLKPKSSAGCDNISTKLLKEIEMLYRVHWALS